LTGSEPPEDVPYYERIDDSFIEPTLTAVLGRASRLMPTQWLLEAIDSRRNSLWAGEEVAYLAFLAISLSVLSLSALGLSTVSASFLLAYSTIRIGDIFGYELKIVLVDVKKDLPHGHVLSANRRVILAWIHVLEFVMIYGLIYLSLQELQGPEAFEDIVDSPIAAFYQSIITATFTGMSINPPASNWALITASSQIMLAAFLFVFILALFVASLRPLRPIDPPPPRRRK
jgi:hypothetical protein